MNLNPATVLDPVFQFLDEILADYGLYLFLAFAWLSPLVLACIQRRVAPEKSQPHVRPASALSYSHRGHNQRQSYFTNTIRL